MKKNIFWNKCMNSYAIFTELEPEVQDPNAGEY